MEAKESACSKANVLRFPDRSRKVSETLGAVDVAMGCDMSSDSQFPSWFTVEPSRAIGETSVAVWDGGKEARGVSGTWSMVDAIGESKRD